MTVLYRKLRVPFHRVESELPVMLARRLGVPRRAIRKLEIVKKSLDSRRGRAPRFEYSLAVELHDPHEERLLARKRPVVEPYRQREHRVVGRITRRPERRPIVVGTGPAGLFAAYRLTQGGIPPIVVERGPDVTERSKRWGAFLKGGTFDAESNLLFGEGGAGTYSDGKLYTRLSDHRVREVLEVLADSGAPREILYDAKPHVGSNRLPSVVRNLRRRLVELGVDFRFQTRMVDLLVRQQEGRAQIAGIETDPAGLLQTDALFVAPGHSARDTYRMLLRRGVAAEPKPFQMGVRIEHSQEIINRIQYGESAGHPALPPAEYQWVEKCRDGDVFSFCMCPGGEILPATERPGYICMNGASRYKRLSPFATSGLVLTVDRERWRDRDPLLGGLLLQEEVESRAAERVRIPFAAPALRLADFLAHEVSTSLPDSSYPMALVPVAFEEFLPRWILEPLREGLVRLGRRYPELLTGDALVTAPESRSSSPLRICRDPESCESGSVKGLFPMGEGAGYAGGIISAAIDGLRCAEAFLGVTSEP